MVCDLGALESGASARVTVVVAPSAAGALLAEVQVSSAAADPHGADDTATASATAVEPPADTSGKKGGCGCSAAGPGGLLWPALLLAVLGRRRGPPRAAWGPARRRRARSADSPQEPQPSVAAADSTLSPHPRSEVRPVITTRHRRDTRASP